MNIEEVRGKIVEIVKWLEAFKPEFLLELYDTLNHITTVEIYNAIIEAVKERSVREVKPFFIPILLSRIIHKVYAEKSMGRSILEEEIDKWVEDLTKVYSPHEYREILEDLDRCARSIIYTVGTTFKPK